MFCEKCGKKVDPKFEVCMYCGNILKEEDNKTQFGEEELKRFINTEKPENKKPISPVPEKSHPTVNNSIVVEQPRYNENQAQYNTNLGTNKKKIIISIIAGILVFVMLVTSFILGNITASKSWIVLLKENTLDADDDEIIEEITTQQASRSIFNFGKTPLYNVSVLEKDGYEYVEAEYTDALGNTFNKIHNFGSGSVWSGYAVFYLNGEYKKLKGTIVADANVALNDSQSVYIYADDVLIYEQHDINKGTDPIEFELSVKNCRLLEISTRKNNGTIRLADVKLS